MIELCTDAGRINEVVNHPSVRPFVGAIELGEVDLAPLIRPENWFLMGEHGGFALIWTAPNIHEWHTFILPEGRGIWAFKAAKQGISFARKNGDKMLWTKIEPSMSNVSAFARRSGMMPTGQVIETFGKPYEVYSMELV